MKATRLRYHHLGIPAWEPRKNETFLPDFGMYVTSHTENPFGIQWMRFTESCPLPELVKRVPHVAFQVDDLEVALEGHELLIPVNSPSPGVRVAFIVSGGAPVEFLEFQADHPDRLPDGFGVGGSGSDGFGVGGSGSGGSGSGGSGPGGSGPGGSGPGGCSPDRCSPHGWNKEGLIDG